MIKAYFQLPCKHSLNNFASNSKMDTYGKRLKEALSYRERDRKWLSLQIGVSVQAIGQVIQGKTNALTASNHDRTATVLDVSPIWLSSGIGSMLTHTAEEPRAPYGNTETLPNLGKVPLIDWVAAGDFCGSTDPYPVGMAEDWLYCPSRHGSKTYALRVRGESMYNPSGSPSFKDGDIIFIDPDKSPIHKSLVICRLDDAVETTFKRLLIEGSTKMLEALNPSWPERIIKVNGNATICGVVIGRFDTF
jgi:SOS-response transcriptional repressor LexA